MKDIDINYDYYTHSEKFLVIYGDFMVVREN